MRFVDLSVPITAGHEDTPDLLRTEIEFSDHAAGAAQIKAMFGVGPELLRDGEGWAVDTFTRLGTHNSTHVDAPYHFNSTIRGRPAQTIDQLPLDWSFAPASCSISMSGRTGRRSRWPTSRPRWSGPVTGWPSATSF